MTNSALGLPAKHPLLFAALNKVISWHHKDGDGDHDADDHDHDLVINGLPAKHPLLFTALNKVV